MDQQMDMVQVGRDRRTVTVHYAGMSEWVRVRGGGVVKASAGGEVYGPHAVVVAAQALANLGGQEVD